MMITIIQLFLNCTQMCVITYTDYIVLIISRLNNVCIYILKYLKTPKLRKPLYKGQMLLSQWCLS